MAITRYYNTNPWVSGPLNFLAGFGQQRQQVKAQEAGMQAQQQQQLWGGLGQGLGAGFNQAIQQPIQEAAQMRMMQAQFRNAQALQQQRYGVPADYGSLIAQAYGTGPTMGGATAVMPPAGIGDTTGEFGVSLPEPGVSQQFPQPQAGGVPPPLLDPSSTAQYQKAREQLVALEAERDKFMAQTRSPMEEVAGLRKLAPAIAQARQQVASIQPPRQPTTQEIVQAGMIPGTMNSVVPNGKGGYTSIKFTPVEDTAITQKPATIQLPDGSERQVGVGAYPWKLEDGTQVVTDVDQNGNTSTRPIAGAGGGSIDADIAKIQKDFAVTTGAGVVTPAAPEMVRKVLEQREEIKQEQKAKPAHDALMKRATELAGFDNREELTLPMVDQWVQNLIATYGDINPEKLPADVRLQLERLTRAAARLRRDALTVE